MYTLSELYIKLPDAKAQYDIRQRILSEIETIATPMNRLYVSTQTLRNWFNGDSTPANHKHREIVQNLIGTTEKFCTTMQINVNSERYANAIAYMRSEGNELALPLAGGGGRGKFVHKTERKKNAKY